MNESRATLMTSSIVGTVAKYRPGISTYATLGGIPAFLLVAYGILWSCGFDVSTVILMLAAILVLIHVWIWRHWVSISEAELCYQTLFRRNRVALRDVESVHIETGSESYYWSRFRCRGYYRMVVRQRCAHIEPLVINITLFSRRDVRAIVDALRSTESKLEKSNKRKK